MAECSRRTHRVTERSIPEATVGRLPVYLRALVELAEVGHPTVSSEALAEAAGVNSAKVRKDLSHLGSYGTRGVGYDVAYLIHQIRRELGLTQHWPIVIVGIGNLGHALANYRGFAERGFRRRRRSSTTTRPRSARAVGELTSCVRSRTCPRSWREHDVAIGVIAPPPRRRRTSPTRWWPAGVRSILNFAPGDDRRCREGVSVRKVDLAVELQILAFYEQRKAALAEVKRGGRAVGRR